MIQYIFVIKNDTLEFKLFIGYEHSSPYLEKISLCSSQYFWKPRSNIRINHSFLEVLYHFKISFCVWIGPINWGTRKVLERRCTKSFYEPLHITLHTINVLTVLRKECNFKMKFFHSLDYVFSKYRIDSFLYSSFLHSNHFSRDRETKLQ